jgi:hypothetical protein
VLREYLGLLRIFTHLTVHGKLPDETPARNPRSVPK